MDEIVQDKRFAHIAKDLRFRQPKREHRKVKIDKRFKGMFDDNRFKLTYLVDKRGRPTVNTTSENLRRYYDMSESEDDENECKDVSDDENTCQSPVSNKKEQNVDLKDSTRGKKAKQIGKEKKQVEAEEDQGRESVATRKKKGGDKKSQKANKAASVEESEPSDSEEEDGGQASVGSDAEPDYARGEAQMNSSSDESEFDYEDDKLDHQWAELDKEAPEAEEVTARLAVCNMDWDRIRAQDIMLVLHSHVPTGGLIKSVTIYPSEYGLKRMEEENVHGPRIQTGNSESHGDEVEDKQGNQYSRERLRQYELQRLKYYFAVVECDSALTANHIYEQCDGVEYESSANKFDLRFIPNDAEFTQQPVQTVSELPSNTSYKASQYFNSALQQSKVNLTWDETDPDRVSVLMKKFDPKEVDEMDVRNYLASDSDDDRLPEVDEGDENEDEEVQVAKYRSLMQELNRGGQGSKSDDEEQGDMEVTWEPELKDNVETLVKEKQKKDTLTPWEQYMEKSKEKKKQKRLERKARATDEQSDADGDSDSEPVAPTHTDNGDVSRKRKKKVKPVDTQAEAELSLLLAEDTDDRHHFNLKKLMKENSSKKAKKQKRKLETEEGESDKFEMDVDDARFTALFHNPNFNIDPSAPEFKKTKVMDELIQQKIRKRHAANKLPHDNTETIAPAVKREDNVRLAVSTQQAEVDQPKRREDSKAALNQLVKSVKAKADLLKQKKDKNKTVVESSKTKHK